MTTWPGANLAFGGGGGQRGRLVDIGAQQRRHGPNAHRHGRLHRLPAQFEQAGGISQ